MQCRLLHVLYFVISFTLCICFMYAQLQLKAAAVELIIQFA